jgi:hypothetical protein
LYMAFRSQYRRRSKHRPQLFQAPFGNFRFRTRLHGISPLVIASDQRRTFSFEMPLDQKANLFSGGIRVSRSASGKRFCRVGHCRNHEFGSPLHSAVNAWGSYGIFYYTSIAPQFWFKVDRELSLERELGRSRHHLKPIVLSRWRTRAFGALPACTGGCADRGRDL